MSNRQPDTPHVPGMTELSREFVPIVVGMAFLGSTDTYAQHLIHDPQSWAIKPLEQSLTPTLGQDEAHRRTVILAESVRVGVESIGTIALGGLTYSLFLGAENRRRRRKSADKPGDDPENPSAG